MLQILLIHEDPMREPVPHEHILKHISVSMKAQGGIKEGVKGSINKLSKGIKLLSPNMISL